MLPKDLLNYARKFSPFEIENAIRDAIQTIGKTVVGRLATEFEWSALQERTRRNLGTNPTPTITSPPWRWGASTTTTSIPRQDLDYTSSITSDNILSPIGDISNSYTTNAQAITNTASGWAYPLRTT